ncbi:MAG: hypothetical protein MUO77_19965 [Anaerolineales bacterium]|nr:hypothetical protein [Anaerolineales bacterium]
MKRIYEFSIKRISGFVKKNLLIVLFAVFICIGVGVSAYLGSDVTGFDNNWSVSITHAPSTPTPTLGPDTGWWTTIVTPTPKK